MTLIKLPKIKISSPIFILSSTLFLVVILTSVFVPKSNWKKLFSGRFNMFATAFQASTTGNWNGLDTWGTNHGLTPFNAPLDVAVASSGDIYVADRENNRIIRLNPDGTFSTSTSASLGLNRPTGIAISSTTGEIYIADLSNYRIIVLNPDLTASTTVDGTSLGLGTIYPEHIAFSPTGDVYFSNSAGFFAADFVVKLNPDLSYATSSDLSVGLYFPHGIAVSASGTVYVADGGGHRFVAFNPDLTLATTTTSSYGNVTGVTVSNTGYVYTEDSTSVVILNPDLSASSTTNINMGVLFGISISSTGEIYLLDNSNNVVLVRNSDLTASTTYNGLTVPGFYIPIEGIDFPGIGDDATNTETVTLTQDQNVRDFTLATSGTLDLNGYTLNVSGDWIGAGGTLLTNGGTINLTSTTTQSILGENTFENLIKLASSSSSLIFDRTATTTITNSLILSGSVGNLLSIGSTEENVVPTFENVVGNGTLSDPEGVSVDSSGNIYVSDAGTSQIVEFDSSGNFVQYLDLTGSGGLDSPSFSAVDSGNNLYVVDYDIPTRILKFVNGVFSTSTNIAGHNLTAGIAVDSSGNIYVDEFGGTNSIFKLDSNFNIVASTSEANNITFSFYWGGMKVHREGGVNYLYVADDSNDRIVKLLASNLSYVSSTQGPIEAPFNFPADVAFDASGNIYVTNNGDSHIIKLASDYSYITQWDGSENGGQSFGGPLQTAIDSNSNLYVVDEFNGQIQKFSVLAPVNRFNILLSPSGTSTFAYLSVSGSTNISTAAFICNLGCVNVGGNTNWTFPSVVRHRRGSIITKGTYIYQISSTTSEITLIGTSTPTDLSKERASTTEEKIISTTTPTRLFNKNLQFGDLSDDVRLLQHFLNTHGYILVNRGFGALEEETNYFGPRTRNAVIRFQEANFDSILKPLNLKRGTGKFLEYSRARANQILSQ